MQKDYIFFDFDGTLVDTSTGIFDSIKYAFLKMGEPIPSQEELRKYIGPPLEWSFSNFNNMNEKDALETTRLFRENYREKGVKMHTLYDGVAKMLESLSENGKFLAVATSKPEHFAVQILKEYDLYKYFKVISGATFDGTRSTKKDVLLHAVNLANVDSLQNCVLIGDTKNDVVGANEVGMDCVGILYGFGTDEELKSAGAIETVNTPQDIVSLFL